MFALSTAHIYCACGITAVLYLLDIYIVFYLNSSAFLFVVIKFLLARSNDAKKLTKRQSDNIYIYIYFVRMQYFLCVSTKIKKSYSLQSNWLVCQIKTALEKDRNKLNNLNVLLLVIFWCWQ